MGKKYLKGNGVARNEEIGIQMLKIPSRKGHINAICELALCYEEGRGVEQNKELGPF